MAFSRSVLYRSFRRFEIKWCSSSAATCVTRILSNTRRQGKLSWEAAQPFLMLQASSVATRVSSHASIRKPDLPHQKCSRRASLLTNSRGFSLQIPIHPSPPHLSLFFNFTSSASPVFSFIVAPRWLPEICVSSVLR